MTRRGGGAAANPLPEGLVVALLWGLTVLAFFGLWFTRGGTARADGARPSTFLLDLTAGGLAVAATAVAAHHLLRRKDRHAQAAVQTQDLDVRALSEVARRTDSLVMITDSRGVVFWVNEAFERMTGWSQEEAVGMRPADLLDPTGPRDATSATPESAQLRQAVEEGIPTSVQYTFRHRGGRQVHSALDVQPIRTDDDQLLHSIIVGVDMTSHRHTEQRLREAKEIAEQALREKATFLTVMSHHLRTPLNGALGAAALLAETQLDEDQRALVSILADAGESMLTMVDNLLTVSAFRAAKIRDVVASVVDVHALVLARFARYRDRAEEGVAYNLVVHPAVPRFAVVDGQCLEQILTNLLDNARLTTKVGSITVALEPHAQEGLFALVVRDTGCGIPPEHLSTVFELQTASAAASWVAPGTLLGLPTTAMLARSLGGRIEVESEPDVGSTFRVILPLPETDDTGPADDGARPGSTMAIQALSVLVVEDNRVNRIILAGLLGLLGIRPDEAADGVEALARVAERRYQVLLVDIDMPVMDGLTLTRRIRAGANGSEPIIVAVTANTLPGDRARILASGMDDCLAKPARLPELRQMLRHQLAARGIELQLEPGPTQGDQPPEAEREPGVTPEADPRRSAETVEDVEDVPPVDLEALGKALDAPERVLADLIGLFAEDARAVFERLAESWRTGDLPDIARAAHLLKGSSANVRADQVRVAAARIESLAADGAPVAEELVDALRQQVERVSTMAAELSGGVR